MTTPIALWCYLLLILTVLSEVGLCSRVSVSRCMETTRKFKVTIDEDQCKGCLICVHICESRGGKILKESDKKTALGGTLPVVDGDCIGCRWCERYCPDFALNVEEAQDA